MSVLIIAEAGINHNGDVELAKKMVLAASFAGADIIKFQTFVAEKEVSHYVPLTEYQQKNTLGENFSSQIDMIKQY